MRIINSITISIELILYIINIFDVLRNFLEKSIFNKDDIYYLINKSKITIDVIQNININIQNNLLIGMNTIEIKIEYLINLFYIIYEMNKMTKTIISSYSYNNNNFNENEFKNFKLINFFVKKTKKLIKLLI